MPGEELIPTGQAYAYTLLEIWREVETMDEEVRVDILRGRMGALLVHKFIAKLSRLWLELAPMIEDRTEDNLKTLAEEFKTYRQFYLSPVLLLEPQNAAKIFELEEACRKVLHIKITKFEDTSL